MLAERSGLQAERGIKKDVKMTCNVFPLKSEGRRNDAMGSPLNAMWTSFGLSCLLGTGLKASHPDCVRKLHSTTTRPTYLAEEGGSGGPRVEFSTGFRTQPRPPVSCLTQSAPEIHRAVCFSPISCLSYNVTVTQSRTGLAWAGGECHPGPSPDRAST